jgi:L-fuculose-phosphate aldolase
LEKEVQIIADEIVVIGRRLYDKGFVASNDGNISVRLTNDRVLITPSGVSKGFMKPADFIITDLNGQIISGDKKPSSELQMHLTVYQERPDITAVCHAHTPYATAFAVAGISIDEPALTEVVVSLGSIPLVPFGVTGTPELSNNLRPYIKNHNAFLLANHGALAIGKDLLTAYYNLETLEHTAHILFLARQLGGAKTFTAEQIEKLIERRDDFGIDRKLGV